MREALPLPGIRQRPLGDLADVDVLGEVAKHVERYRAEPGAALVEGRGDVVGAAVRLGLGSGVPLVLHSLEGVVAELYLYAAGPAVEGVEEAVCAGYHLEVGVVERVGDVDVPAMVGLLVEGECEVKFVADSGTYGVSRIPFFHSFLFFGG